jgi:hypothetical protein
MAGEQRLAVFIVTGRKNARRTALPVLERHATTADDLERLERKRKTASLIPKLEDHVIAGSFFDLPAKAMIARSRFVDLDPTVQAIFHVASDARYQRSSQTPTDERAPS